MSVVYIATFVTKFHSTAQLIWYSIYLAQDITSKPILTHIPCNLACHNSYLSCPIVLKYCTAHGSDTAVRCAKFLNDWATGMDVMNALHLRYISKRYPALQQFYALRVWQAQFPGLTWCGVYRSVAGAGSSLWWFLNTTTDITVWHGMSRNI